MNILYATQHRFLKMKDAICCKRIRQKQFRSHCLILITTYSILVLAYTVYGSLPSRLFSYRQTCKLNFKGNGWNVSNNTSWELLEKQITCNLEPGGRYKPETYVAQNDIVVVIPYRNREEQLKTFMRYMHPYLQLKELAYSIVVVEMTPRHKFNRGLLFNVGFEETIKVTDQQCFIFHDVDLLPLNINTPYNCEGSPLHMSVAIDIYKYKLPYQSIFGGICALKKEHFQRINGFSNKYFGWGGEDDDLHDRVTLSNFTISRLSGNDGLYHMLPHPDEPPNPQRFELLKTVNKRRSVDGLNSLKYQIVKRELKPLYTWILVDVNATDI